MQPSANNPTSGFPHNTSLPSAEDQLESLSVWKTNLMLPHEQARVDERAENFKKRTSFQDSLILDHLQQMLKGVAMTDLKVNAHLLPKNDHAFEHFRMSKHIQEISSNIYLTEYQKWQVVNCLLQNQQNFTIFFRITNALDEHKAELCYLLSQLLLFVSAQINTKVKGSTSQEGLFQLMDKHRLALVDHILNQENIKLIQPFLFSNVNEVPLMKIINCWFYHVLAIKVGLYGEDLQMEEEETYFELQPENQLEL